MEPCALSIYAGSEEYPNPRNTQIRGIPEEYPNPNMFVVMIFLGLPVAFVKTSSSNSAELLGRPDL